MTIQSVTHYYEIQEEYKKKYGEKVIVFYQLGSFYEIYANKEDEYQMVIGSDLLNLRIAKKAESFMQGFPDHSVQRFENILLSEGFTVVIVNQRKVGKGIIREVARVSSPGCSMTNENDDVDAILASVLLENIKDGWYVSLSVADNNRGSINVYSVPQETGASFNNAIEQINDFIDTHKISEILVNMVSESEANLPKLGKDVLTHKKVYSKKVAKGEFLDWKVYQKESLVQYFQSFSNLYESIFDTLNLDKASTSDVGNMILLLEFLKDHEPVFVESLSRPTFIETNSAKTNLISYNNVHSKLQVFSKDGDDLMKYIDKTLTVSGKRKLRGLIANPSCVTSVLENRYDSVQYFIDNRHLLDEIKTHLKIRDLDRIFRRYALGKVDVYTDIPRVKEMNGRINTLINIFKETEKVPTWFPTDDVIDYFKEYAQMVEDKFDFDNIKSSGCAFKSGICPELDELWGKINGIEVEIERVRIYMSEIIDADVKTSYNEKNGFYYETTKKRAEELKKKFKDENPENLNISTATSQAKITSDSLNKLSNGHVVLKSKIHSQTTAVVKEMTVGWYQEYYEQSLKHVIDALAWMDVFYSYAKTAIEWNYYRPHLVNSENSFVDAKELRHPIIEQLLRNEKQSFIPNDIHVGCDKSYLLYGVNSVGKSSLMKSIGLSVIMAQAGMYVASSDYKLCPYEKVIVRIGNTDDLFDAHSSFVSEIKEAARVVKYADNKTLVIADEFCASTERDSATQIVTTMLQWLSEKNSSYVFATHLFELLDTTENLEGLNVVHLKITVDEDGWTFDRKLTEGPPAERNYGAMIAKTMFGDKKFLKMLDRNKTKKNIERKVSKRSRYNSSVVVKECAVCGYEPSGSMSLPLDVHHINMQCTANVDGFIDNYHKDTKSNLVVLCKTCHIDAHSDRLKIDGYMQHNTGVKLKFNTLNS